jgi:glycosyltransferase involved in cell wall biosynthesis
MCNPVKAGLIGFLDQTPTRLFISNMKILHLNSTDTSGGAARATYRLHRGLRSNGINSQMLVQKKISGDESVHGLKGVPAKIYSRIRKKIDQLPVKQYRSRDSEIFSPAWIPERRAKQIARHDPDIVHIHWVAGGFIRPVTVGRLNVPIVWTCHDMWPFTGGCHYSKSCDKYKTECRACPHLNSGSSQDLANAVWKRKQNAWNESNLTVVTPSRWLAQQVRESSLLGKKQVEVIPNGLDTDAFRPRSRLEGIQKLGLNREKDYFLFGASYQTTRKGGDLLEKALINLRGRSNIVALVFGNAGIRDDSYEIPIRHLGWLPENRLQLVYSTADATIVPSRQEAFGQTASESLASGTPVVAFDATGLQDVVDHKKTGYLSDPFDPDDLANGINWVLANQDRNKRLSQGARAAAQDRFAIETVVRQYQNLYKKLG